MLYGTNAVGKTSLIRSIGIAIIMAQSGLYVPCSQFVFSPYKKIFSRILNNDMGNINTKHPVQKRLKEKMIQDLKLAKDIALTIFGSKTSPTVIFTERTLEFVKRC